MENLNEILEAAKAKNYRTKVYTEKQTNRWSFISYFL